MSDVSVTVAARSVELVGGRATVTVSVTNAAAGPQRIVLRAYGVVPAATPGPGPGASAVPPVDPASWTTIERPLREIPAGGTEQYAVSIASVAAPPGEHPVKLVAYPAERAPEEYADQGQVVRVVVPAGPPPPTRRRWLFVLVAVALLLLIAAVGFALTRDGSVIVPDVVGRTSVDAEAAVRAAGLDATVEAELGPEPLGVVVRQMPVATSEVGSGSSVLLVVRVGVFLPDVTGSPVDAALARLGDTVTVTQEPQEADAPPGTVVGMDPAAGTEVAEGSSVRLLVATPRTTEVPGLVNVDLDAAERRLESAGLSARVERGPLCRGFLRTCVIVSQEPGPGVRVPLGTVVALVTT